MNKRQFPLTIFLTFLSDYSLHSPLDIMKWILHKEFQYPLKQNKFNGMNRVEISRNIFRKRYNDTSSYQIEKPRKKSNIPWIFVICWYEKRRKHLEIARWKNVLLIFSYRARALCTDRKSKCYWKESWFCIGMKWNENDGMDKHYTDMSFGGVNIKSVRFILLIAISYRRCTSLSIQKCYISARKSKMEKFNTRGNESLFLQILFFCCHSLCVNLKFFLLIWTTKTYRLILRLESLNLNNQYV